MLRCWGHKLHCKVSVGLSLCDIPRRYLECLPQQHRGSRKARTGRAMAGMALATRESFAESCCLRGRAGVWSRFARRVGVNAAAQLGCGGGVCAPLKCKGQHPCAIHRDEPSQQASTGPFAGGLRVARYACDRGMPPAGEQKCRNTRHQRDYHQRRRPCDGCLQG